MRTAFTLLAHRTARLRSAARTSTAHRRVARLVAALSLLLAGVASGLAPAAAHAQNAGDLADIDDDAVHPNAGHAHLEAGASSGEPATPAAPEAARLHHVAPAEATDGEDLRVAAVLSDAWVEGGLVLRYRAAGQGAFRDALFERSSAGGYFATIPAEAVQRPGVEYYIAGVRGDRAHFASKDAPHLVRVEPAPEARWIEVERRRLAGRYHGIALRMTARDFGDRHGSDRYIRGEVEWTYRLVAGLYSVSLGYGFLDGETPSGTADDATGLSRGARWGHGRVRLRLGDSMWLDTKAIMGIGDDGFIAGGGGQLILGDDWRTAVLLGGEVMSELSYRAWITLQWDTVPPLLMRATAATSNQPNAQIDAGSYIEYELAYPFDSGWTLAGTVNFGARGNRPGGLGGGLATSYQF